jgi:drug/metabolite transporter (DMT)-like permease
MAARVSDNPALWIGCACMLIFGSLNVVMKDWQVKLGFYAPYLWNCVTFVGQSFFLLVYYCRAQTPDGGDKDGGSERKPSAPLHAYALVTLFDFVALSLINVAYLGLPGSVLQMLKGLKLIFTFILSTICLNKRMNSHQYLGVSLTILGLFLVGLTAVHGTGWASSGHAVRSLIIGFFSCLAGALQFVWEEKTMKQYDVDPELFTGMEGIIGVVYGVIVLFIVDAMKVENVVWHFEDMWHRKTILCAFIIFTCAVALFNYSALVVTKNSSAMLRSLLDVSRTMCIWVVEMLCSWDAFSWVELQGFAIMVIGMMIYSKNLKVPCLRYDEEERLPIVKASGSK